MNFVLTWAFVPLILALAFRFILTELHAVPWYDTAFLTSFELYSYSISLALAFISLWHNCLRDRCPDCRTLKPRLTHEKEIERFIGTKKVSGRDGQGRTTMQHVSTTFARMEYHYTCSNAHCRSRWFHVGKREVT